MFSNNTTSNINNKVRANLFLPLFISLIMVLTCTGLVNATITITGDIDCPYTMTEQPGEPDYEVALVDDEDGIFTISGTGVNEAFIVDDWVNVDFGGYPVEIKTEYVWINDPEHRGDPDDPIVFINYDGIFTEDVNVLRAYNVSFGTEEDPAIWGVSIWKCENFLIQDCNFHYEGNSPFTAALLISNIDYNGVTSGLVQGCEVTVYAGNGSGIRVDSFFGENQTVVITECHVTTEGKGIYLGNLTDQAPLDEDSPIRVFGNKIVGGGGVLSTGVYVAWEVEQRSLLIRNNVILNCGRGIGIRWEPEEYGNCFPLIYNNAIFGVSHGSGIQFDLHDHGINAYNGIRIRNNVIWESATGEGQGSNSGISIYLGPDASLNDVDIANNVIGDFPYGIKFFLGTIEDEDNDEIDFNAFKNISTEYYIVYVYQDQNLFWHYDDISEESMGDNCIVHDPDGEGEDERFHGQFVRLLDESPENGFWDFHILIDDIEPPDRNMDLVDTGDHREETWMDPPWCRFLRRVGRPHRHIPHSPPDMGIYGGPFSKGNIGWINRQQEDWIYVFDRDYFCVNMPSEYYYLNLVHPCEPVGPGIGETFHVEAGTVIDFNENILDVAGSIQVDGGEDTMGVAFIFDDGGYIALDNTTNVANSYLNYCDIYDADYGFYLTGVDDCGGDRLDIDNCTIEDCGTGISANNSRAAITNTKITGSYGASGGNAIYLTGCTAGQVIIDNCDITGNGYDNTYLSGAIYNFNSDPEIINTKVYLNNGTGITCIGSSPDLDASDAGGNQSNEIRDNGPESPFGSDGAEIYLDYQSTPDIKYNNIYHCDAGPPFIAKGYAIYLDGNTCTITATDNWWGTSSPGTYESDLFYEGVGSITYSPAAASAYSVDNVEEYELAMGLWSRGEYARAAYYFRRTVADKGAIGINSVHYLTGCVGEMENGDFNDLRDFLLEAADRHRDERVSRIAERWATHCLTEMREYEDAMDEYDDRAQNADCLRDSVMAVIDYLAVEELYNGDRINASGEDYMKQMHKLMSLLDRPEDSEALSPETFAIARAYPNPFNSMTNIAFNLQDDSNIKLTIHDLQGREVSALYEGQETSGVHSLSWDASGLASGVYICRLQSDSKMATIKLVMVR